MVFVNVHAATEDKNDKEKDEFYSLLDSTLCEIPRLFLGIIMQKYDTKNASNL